MKWLMKFSHIFFLCTLILFSCKTTNNSKAKPEKPNILFIAIDDLRPELGSYGSEVAITPNMDRLSAHGMQFNRAYCQQAICSPSRASLMTGARPETINVWENYTYFRDENPDIITLPQHFRSNGYETVYCGKIYHGRFTDDEKSWSIKPSVDKLDIEKPRLIGGYADPANVKIFQDEQAAKREKYGDNAHYALGRGPAYECYDVPDHTYMDGYNTELAIATMNDLVENNDKPFFLGLGFKLPHLDWIAPKKYWDLYDRDSIPLAAHDVAPEGGAAMGLHASFELRVRAEIPKKGPIEGDFARTLKHAYLASVSYVDALIGKILNALDEAGIRDNTIIMLWADHGWHLGDMGVWGKATNYEISTRVPLIVWSPDMPDKNRGKQTNALVELVDMYPTLCEMAGIELPEHLEGHSFAPLLEDPDLNWKKAAFTQYPNPALREWAANPLTPEMRELFFGPLIEEVEERIITQQGEKWDRDLYENKLMGYSMRTDDHHLILWKDRTAPDGEPLFVELFDHNKDPEETKNIAKDEPELVNKLIDQFNKGWKGNLPNFKS